MTDRLTHQESFFSAARDTCTIAHVRLDRKCASAAGRARSSPAFPPDGREKRRGADLPQKSADSQRKSNAATLSAVHKRAQGGPVRRSSTLTRAGDGTIMQPRNAGGCQCDASSQEREESAALTAATLAGALLCGGPSARGRKFPRSSDQADRAVRRRRAAGRRGAHHRRLPVGTSRPGGGGKPCRRRRHARGPAGGDIAARRLHAACRHRRIAVDQPATLQGCGHRPAQAVRRGRPRVVGAAGARHSEVGSRA